jgi:hypothetical protein
MTIKGHLGFGPASVREGDQLCVLYGATVPFILRSYGESYNLIGECYVDGFMNGEAVEQCRRGAISEKVFDLC